MTASHLLDAVRNAPNAAALRRAVDRADPKNAIGIYRVGRSTAWEATNLGYPMIGSCPFSDLKARLASLCDDGQGDGDYAELRVHEGPDGCDFRFSAEDRADAARKAVLSLDGYCYGIDDDDRPLVIELTAFEIKAEVRTIIEAYPDAPTWNDVADTLETRMNAIARRNGCRMEFSVTYKGQTDRHYGHEAV